LDEATYLELLAAFATGQDDVLRAALVPDVVVDVGGDDPILSGRYEGPERVMTFVATAARMFERGSARLASFAPRGNELEVVVEVDDGKGRTFELSQRLSLTDDGQIRSVKVMVTNE